MNYTDGMQSLISTALCLSLVVSTTCGLAAHSHADLHPEEVEWGETHVHLPVFHHEHAQSTDLPLSGEHPQASENHASHCVPVIAIDLLIDAFNDELASIQKSMGLLSLGLSASTNHAATDSTGSDSCFQRGASYFQRSCVIRR
jgi:hypothetical protein